MATSDGYGYGGRLESIRKTYGNLPRAYLDNAGAPLFPQTVPRLAAEALCAQPMTNPHSQASQESSTSLMISQTRMKILKKFNCSPADYDVVFCANATAAAKLVGEALHCCEYSYLLDSHTSLVGLRELAKSYTVRTSFDELTKGSGLRVVSWPLQSNFDGSRYTDSARAISDIHESNGLVLLDIASYAATEAPDLGELCPDFAILSFYKIYGLPDLGALIVRKTEQVLDYFYAHKRYFGGGTVAALAPGQKYAARKPVLVDMLEDGTAPFHSILVLRVAMDEFERLYGSDSRIAAHTKAVARYCVAELSRVPGCKIFSSGDSPIVSFMLEGIGHNEFAMLAALQDVHVRAGTMCNIGAFAQVTKTADDTIIKNHKTFGKTCNDDISFIQGRPTGVVRVSFGPYSSYEDVSELLHVVRKGASRSTFSTPEASTPAGQEELSEMEPAARVVALYTYPIKSCSALRISSSPVGAAGLQYDREFCLVDLGTNKVLSLKNHRAMAFVRPSVAESYLTVSCARPGTSMPPLRIPYDCSKWASVVARDTLALNMDADVVDFFSRAVGIPCTIAKQDQAPMAKKIDSAALQQRTESSLANSSPLLVVAATSAADLDLADVTVFRPNIVVETSAPWAEDAWSALAFPQAAVAMLGKCRRCNMVTVTANGESDPKPYMQLCKYRRQNGKLYFGQHAKLVAQKNSAAVISVGDKAYES